MTPRRLAGALLRVLLLALVLWGVYRVLAPELGRISWADLTRWRPAPLPLLASFGLLVAVYIGHALLWRRILSDVGVGHPSARTAVRVWFLASLGRYLPGKLWQLAGLAVLSKRAGIPAGPAAATAVLGQFGFLATGMLFLGLTLPQWRSVLAGGAATDAGGAAADDVVVFIGAALLALVAIPLWVLVATPAGHGFRGWIIRRAGERAGERLRAAFALADRVRVRDALIWAAGYALSWVVLGAAFALFVGAFDASAFAAARYLGGRSRRPTWRAIFSCWRRPVSACARRPCWSCSSASCPMPPVPWW
jgi:hypothetical protein